MLVVDSYRKSIHQVDTIIAEIHKDDPAEWILYGINQTGKYPLGTTNDVLALEEEVLRIATEISKKAEPVYVML